MVWIMVNDKNLVNLSYFKRIEIKKCLQGDHNDPRFLNKFNFIGITEDEETLAWGCFDTEDEAESALRSLKRILKGSRVTYRVKPEVKDEH